MNADGGNDDYVKMLIRQEMAAGVDDRMLTLDGKLADQEEKIEQLLLEIAARPIVPPLPDNLVAEDPRMEGALESLAEQ